MNTILPTWNGLTMKSEQLGLTSYTKKMLIPKKHSHTVKQDPNIAQQPGHEHKLVEQKKLSQAWGRLSVTKSIRKNDM